MSKSSLAETLRELRRSWPVIKEWMAMLEALFSPGRPNVFVNQQPSANFHANSHDDPYKILGVSPSDDLRKIKSIYHRLAKIYHPDNPETGNEDAFRRIKEAYEKILRERSYRS